MTNRPAVLRQYDLTRYAKALRAAGVLEWRIVVRRDGTHEIIAGKPPDSGDVANDWEQDGKEDRQISQR